MANTIIRIKSSGVIGNTPATLEPGELAINYADGKIYYGNVTSTSVLFDAITEPAGLNGEIQFNNLGSFGSSSGLVYYSANNTLVVNNLIVGSNNIVSRITASFDKANTATDIASAAFASANSFSSSITAAYNQSNTAIQVAAAAFAQANAAFDNAVAMAIALG
jgi:hypothetical protein